VTVEVNVVANEVVKQEVMNEKVKEEEMFNIFNMGIGMVVAVKEEDAKDVVRLLEEQGEMARIIGRTIQGAGVTFNGGTAL
ncbi:AIR synthase-related protein, partial [Bacillus sp. HC-TM]